MSNLKELWTNIALENYGEDRVDVRSSSLLILYPELTVTKVGGTQSHTIHDLVVILPFSDPLFDTMRYIKGYRLTLTNGEYNASYTHSHLPVDSMLKQSRKMTDYCFCMGMTQCNILRQEQNWTKDTIEAFFVFLDLFLEQETTSGIPFNRMSSLSSSSRVYRINSFSDEEQIVIQRTIKKRPSIYEYFLEGNQLKARIRNEEELLTIPGLTHCYVDEKGKDYTDSSIAQSIPDELEISSTTPLFKGRNRVVITTQPRGDDTRIERIPRQTIRILNKKCTEYVNDLLYKKKYTFDKEEWNSYAPDSPQRILADKMAL